MWFDLLPGHSHPSLTIGAHFVSNRMFGNLPGSVGKTPLKRYLHQTKSWWFTYCSNTVFGCFVVISCFWLLKIEIWHQPPTWSTSLRKAPMHLRQHVFFLEMGYLESMHNCQWLCIENNEQKVLDSAAGGCFSTNLATVVTQISEQDVNSVDLYRSTIKTSKPLTFLVSSVYDNNFIPFSYHQIPTNWIKLVQNPRNGGYARSQEPSQSWNAGPLLRRIWSLHGKNPGPRRSVRGMRTDSAISYIFLPWCSWDAILILGA